MSITIIKDQIMYYSVTPAKDESDRTIIMLHDAFTNDRSFGEVTNLISKRLPDNTILQLDLPAHGQSLGKPIHNIGGIADIVTELIVRLEKNGEIQGPYLLLGQGMGTSVAFTMCLSSHIEVEAVFAINAAPKWPATSLLKYVPDSALRDAISELFTLDYNVGTTDEQQVGFALGEVPYLVASQEACLADIEALKNFDITDKISEINVPITLIAGTRNMIATVENAEAFIHSVGGWSLTEFPKGTHTISLKDPHGLVDEVEEFIEHTLT